MMMPSELFVQPSVPWKPHSYQKKGVKWLLEHAAGALFLDPGMGKTSITLAALKILKSEGMLSPVLLVAPLKPCYLVWPKELKKWTYFSGLSSQIMHGKFKESCLKDLKDINIINPEGLDWLLAAEKTRSPSGKVSMVVDAARFKKLGFGILVIDELSKFKAYDVQRFKAMKQIIHLFSRRWGLTGSPASNGLMGMFGECYMLDQGRTFGQYITHFRRQYYTQNPWNRFDYTLKPGADQQIYGRIKPLALRLAAEDYLELPEVAVNDIPVELPASAWKVYKELEDDLLTRISDETVTAANAAVASMKCRQVVAGGIYLDQQLLGLAGKFKPEGGRKHVDIHSAKADALAELVDELEGEPLLVAYDFQHDLERINKALGYEVPHIGGGVSAKRSVELERLWNQGKLPVLLGHPQSIAHGLNLQDASCHHICFHSLTWDYELYDQFVWRLRRPGSHAKRIFVHRLVVKNTVDESIIAALSQKKGWQQALFDALKKRSRGGFK